MDIVVERCAGLDVHKDLVVACVRVPAETGEREIKLASFSTYTKDLLALRDWLVALGVTRVGMEATGVYWKPVLYVLEDELDCWLLNARHMRNVPGRKTDVADAEWICQLTEHGLVRASFVPPPEIRDIRELTRYRRTVVEERSREAQRLDKVLQDAGIKLSSVASDILGASGRAMLTALVSGTEDPEVLADLAKGLLRKKLPQLRSALEGRFGLRHGVLVTEILAHLDYLDEAIERLPLHGGLAADPLQDQAREQGAGSHEDPGVVKVAHGGRAGGHAEDGDQAGHPEGQADLAAHGVEGGAGGEALRRQRSGGRATQRGEHQADAGASDERPG